MNDFTPTQNYVDLLLKHAVLSKKYGAKDTDEYKELQNKLLGIELAMPTKKIIQNTKYAFPNEEQI